MELNNCQFLKPLVLLAALKQFEYQATNRLLLSALDKYAFSLIGWHLFCKKVHLGSVFESEVRQKYKDTYDALKAYLLKGRC